MQHLLVISDDSRERNICIYNLNSKSCIRKVSCFAKSKISFILYKKESNLLLVASDNDKRILVKDLKNEKNKKTLFLKGHSNGINCGKLLLNGQFASGSYDETIRIWNMENNNNQCRQFMSGKTVSCLEQLQNGWLVSAGGDFMEQVINIWDLEENKCIRSIGDHSSFITCLKALNKAQDECLFANGSYDRTVKIWNSETGQCLKVLEGHTGIVFSLELNPRQNQLISSSGDNTIRVWSLNKQKDLLYKCVSVLEGHCKDVRCIRMNANRDDQLLSASEDRTIKVWDLNTSLCLDTICAEYPIAWFEFCI